MRVRRSGTTVMAVLAVLTGCTSDPPTPAKSAGPATSATSATSPTSPTQAVLSPSALPLQSRRPEAVAARDAAGRALPRSDRPRVSLTYDLTGWREGRVAGTEQIEFRPDLDVCELVVRLWPNRPVSTATGALLTVTHAAVDGRSVTPRPDPAGGTPDAPTLLELPLDECAKPGDVVRATFDFELVLGLDAADRAGFSTARDVAWLGSAFPMLAWEHGAGWQRDPAVDLYGDMQAAEAFDLRLEVVAPAADAVHGQGRLVAVSPGPAAARTHRFAAPAMRDVGIVVGTLTTTEAAVSGVRVHLATPAGSRVPPQRWLADVRRALPRLEKAFGPFPYDDIWVGVVISNLGSGFEYPGSTILPDIDPAEARVVVAHELAHSYFWGLVGNNTARDPWLDEALATYASMVVAGEPDGPPPEDSELPVGAPMSFWAAQATEKGRVYVEHVYGRGGHALWRARETTGATSFDAAIRRYLADRAHRSARPEDLAAALRPLPAALAVLQEVGALP